jgi:hypothetical protein
MWEVFDVKADASERLDLSDRMLNLLTPTEPQ